MTTHITQGTNQLLTPEASDEFVALLKKTVRSFPERNIIVREHPTHPLSELGRQELLAFPSITLLSPPVHTLDEVFDRSIIAVSAFSTTLLEAIAAGIIPLMFNRTSFPEMFPNFVAEGAGAEVKSVPEAVTVLRSLIENPKARTEFEKPMDEFRKKYFAAGAEDAVRAIVYEIEHPS